MGLFDFLKSKKASSSIPAAAQPVPNDLIFKSGSAAIEYVKQYMKVDWQPNSVVVALLGHAELHKGILSATVLTPYDHGNFVQLTTFTTIRAVESQKSGKTLIDECTTISTLGLKDGDLVTLILADRKPELIKLMPDNFDGWGGIRDRKKSANLQFSGWRMAHGKTI
jgi:hypothetical protein